ncbi:MULTISPECIES: hypothetical protein [unclassified Janthinobacterium]|uniref:hypothetical protein n=1 Tax=unclassified Janthinobacterium TaxID=2610881 RepID=UPI000873FCF7|nr:MULTISPECIES: hypothetical protein [unclassified Janthinobacterium]MCC7680632.1 hypothetical protein [Janthinobacterium sp. FW305-128]OEZ93495.1 hypothetical protein JAB8_06110 [Janthinobacterium sp. HH106]
MGQVHVRDPNHFGFGVAGAHKVASYIAKYCGKEMQCRALDQKRYFRSKGIVVPVMYKQRKAANVLNDRYPMAYKS